MSDLWETLKDDLTNPPETPADELVPVAEAETAYVPGIPIPPEASFVPEESPAPEEVPAAPAEDPAVEEPVAEESVAEEPAPLAPPEIPPQTEPVSDPDAVLAAVEALGKRMDALEKNRQIITDLHEELQEYKADISFKLKKNLIDTLIRMQTEGEREIRSLEAKEDSFFTKQRFLSNLEMTSDDLLQNLELEGVTSFRGEIGEAFAPKRQTIIKKIETDDETKAGTIAESLSLGFAYGDWILYREKVNIFEYVKKETEEA